MSTAEQAERREPVARTAVSVALAVSAYGISFGALGVAAGLDVWQACVLSLVMFSGGSQFALVGVIAAGGAAAGPAAIASATLLGSRNAIYAMRMGPIIGKGWARRLVAAHLTIDESTAVATAQKELPEQRKGFWLTGILVFVGWNITTLAGALLGNVMGDVSRYGLDAAAAAAFLGLLWPRLSALQPIAVAVGAAVVATVLTPWLPPGLPVIAAALVAVVVGLTNWGAR
ncbi:AzlC family ABC transporter permease [Salinibacterium sp. dk2585]|uniref:AzlC family ABC transporter permease n=1 Tax=unclassified Salinibacterium TaxID=2632331 RepID=UPI0011C242E4|nr:MULTISPECIES: AzlC family ABC transporter permease [unclassified Salinibacterium]QEE61376.1 AzlC family ABC transporter permease [Salinibacterium sp. dk2585]TXK54053.1 AzlC family ABC transporter permease [Salinibacterium sp. dk5596]